MNEANSNDSRARALLALLGACLFLAIFASIDTSEHYRAWRTALGWTREQRITASALDTDMMYGLILAALAFETAVIALTLAGGMSLGIATATESKITFFAAGAMGWISASFGVIYAILMIIYEIKVGPRKVLKGPIFDYNLHLQPPILLAVAGFPIVMIIYGLFSAKQRRLRAR
jgi:hypothetical protein